MKHLDHWLSTPEPGEVRWAEITYYSNRARHYEVELTNGAEHVKVRRGTIKKAVRAAVAMWEKL